MAECEILRHPRRPKGQLWDTRGVYCPKSERRNESAEGDLAKYRRPAVPSAPVTGSRAAFNASIRRPNLRTEHVCNRTESTCAMPEAYCAGGSNGVPHHIRGHVPGGDGNPTNRSIGGRACEDVRGVTGKNGQDGHQRRSKAEASEEMVGALEGVGKGGMNEVPYPRYKAVVGEKARVHAVSSRVGAIRTRLFRGVLKALQLALVGGVLVLWRRTRQRKLHNFQMQHVVDPEGLADGGGRSVHPDNLISKMTSSERAWDAVAAFVTGVLKEKEVEERRRQLSQQ